MTSHLTAAARFVRITTATFVMVMLVGFVAVQSFANNYGRPGAVRPVDAGISHSALAAAISAQESSGMTCSEKPSLTDIVLFQRLEKTDVMVLRFDQAIAASTAHEGWIRRYCV